MKDNCKYLAVFKYLVQTFDIVCNIRDECNDGQSLNLLIKKMNKSLISSMCLKNMKIKDSCKNLAVFRYFGMRPLKK